MQHSAMTMSYITTKTWLGLITVISAESYSSGGWVYKWSRDKASAEHTAILSQGA